MRGHLVHSDAQPLSYSYSSRFNNRNGDDQYGSSGDDDATSGAQRDGASLKGANEFHSRIYCRSEESDVEPSDTEYTEVPRSWGSKMEMSHISDDSDWQQCLSLIHI